MKVIIKEPYPVARTGLNRLMKRYRTCHITSCANVAQAIEAVNQSNEPVRMIIFSMHVDEVDEMRRLMNVVQAHQDQDAYLLILSEMCEAVYAPLCFASGAKGFVSLHEPLSMILAAIKTVMRGEIYIDRQLAQQPVMRQVISTGQLNVLELLSCRERQIAECLVKNASLQEISAQLNLRYTTVATYQNRMLRKISLRRVSDLNKLLGEG